MTNYKRNYKSKIVKLQVDLFPTDKDIVEWLKQNRPIATYLKKLIRNDMPKKG